MPIGSSLTDRYFVSSYVRTIVRLLHKNTFLLHMGCKMRTYFRREPAPEGKGRAEVQQKFDIRK